MCTSDVDTQLDLRYHQKPLGHDLQVHVIKRELAHAAIYVFDYKVTHEAQHGHIVHLECCCTDQWDSCVM